MLACNDVVPTLTVGSRVRGVLEGSNMDESETYCQVFVSMTLNEINWELYDTKMWLTW